MREPHPSYPTEGRERVLGVSPLGCAGLMAIPTLLIVGLAVWVVFFDADLEPRLATGNRGVLESDGLPIAVADDRAFPEVLLELKSAKIAYEYLLEAGRAFTVEEGTAVRVIDIRMTFLRIRIESGEHRGESGWVSEEWVRPVVD